MTEEPRIYVDEYETFIPYDVTCARCGAVGSSDDFLVEEGDEWECLPCWEREEAALQARWRTFDESM